MKNNFKVCDFLIKKAKYINDNWLEQIMIKAIKKKNLEACKYLIKKGVNLDTQ